MKVTGTQLNEFYLAWPFGPDWHHDEGELETDKSGLILDDDGKYDIDEALGGLCWHGTSSDAPTHVEIGGVKVDVYSRRTFSVAYRAWRGKKKAPAPQPSQEARLHAVLSAVHHHRRDVWGDGPVNHAADRRLYRAVEEAVKG